MGSIDTEQLRSDLIDYFGSATQVNGFAIVDVIEIETADVNKLIDIAIENGFNLDDYYIKIK